MIEVGDEVLIIRAYGLDLDPPVAGVVLSREVGHTWRIVCEVRGKGGELHRCSEGWLILAHPLIREEPSLADA